MKSKRLFRKITSVILAAAMTLSPVSSAFATEAETAVTELSVTADEPAAVQTDAEGSESAETAPDTAAVSEDTAVETAEDAQGKTADAGGEEAEVSEAAEEDYNPYIILLPSMDGVEYSYSAEHYLAELSTSEYSILVYEAGEVVNLTVETDMEFYFIDVSTGGKYILVEADHPAAEEQLQENEIVLAAEEEADANAGISFVMPSADLAVQFVEEVVVEKEAAPAEEVQVTEAPVTEVPVTETVVEESVPEDPAETAEDVVEEDAEDLTEAATEGLTEKVMDTLEAVEEATEAVETELAESATEVFAAEETEFSTEAEVSETELFTEEVETELMEEAAPAEELDAAIEEANLLEEQDYLESVLSKFPEAGSEVMMNGEYVWMYDTGYDYKSYVPEYTFSNDVTISYESGSINFNSVGIYNIKYSAVVNMENVDYSWYLIVPMYVVSDKGLATVGSDNLDDLMHNEQSSEYTGIVPSIIGTTVDGGEYTAIVGEEFNLWDLNLGYDLELYNVGVYDEGGFNTSAVGDYEVTYEMNSYYNPEYRWYAKCIIHVVEAEDAAGMVTVHIASGLLQAVIRLEDGSDNIAAYGSDLVTAKGIKELVVTSTRNEDIKPSITVYKNGEVVDNTLFAAAEVLEENVYTVTVNDDFVIGEDGYKIVVDYPDYDPTQNGTMKATGGLYRPEAFDDELMYEIALQEAEEDVVTVEEDDFYSSDEVIKTYATTIASKTYNSIGSCTNLAGKVTNYNPPGTAYNQAYIKFNTSFKNKIKAFLSDNGVELAKSLPAGAWTSCSSGHIGAGWANTSYCTSTKATVYLYDTDGDGVANRVTVKFTASCSTSGYQTMYGSFSRSLSASTGELKIVKKSSSSNFITVSDSISLDTSFTVYSDAECTDAVETVKLNPDSSKSSASVLVELEEGSYWIKEHGRCPGHASNTGTIYGPYKITAGSTTTTDAIYNDPVYFQGKLLKKVDANTYEPLEGAIYKFTTTIDDISYQWFFKTDSNGEIYYDEAHYVSSYNGQDSSALFVYNSTVGVALPRCNLSVVEVYTPDGYFLDAASYSITMAMQTDANGHYTIPQLTATPVTVYEVPEEGYLQLKKSGEAFGTTMPNSKYSLENAVYGVYDEYGDEVATLTTNASGVTDIITLDPGDYTVREISAPTGFQVDSTSYNVNVAVQQTTTLSVTDKEITGSYKISKKLEDAEPDAIKENRDFTQVSFTLTYLDAKDAEGKDIVKKGTCDKDGNLTFEGLFFGKWKLEEIGTVDYHRLADPIDIVVEESKEYQMEIVNYRYEDWIVLAKRDIDTGKTIPKRKTTFQILDENGTPISLTVEGTDTPTSIFVTDDMGWVYFEEKIPGGKYTLKEVTPPQGYNVGVAVDFEITTDADGGDPIEITMSDKHVTTTDLSLVKNDSVSGKAAGADFQFQVVAAENIVDPSGTVYTGYAAGSVIETLTTDKDGNASMTKELYPGKYYVQETVPADNYQLNDTKFSFEVVEKEVSADVWEAVIVYDGEETNTIQISDEPVMRPIRILKLDAHQGTSAGAGFTFEIVAESVVDGTGNVREGFEKGTVVDTITTGADGTATSKDLYIGTYLVREVSRTEGYLLNETEYTVAVTDEDKTSDPVEFTIKDEPLMKSISVTKIDAVTGNRCGAGFTFEIVTVEDCVDGSGKTYAGYEAGTVVDTIVTDEDGIATSKELYLGNYYIQEVKVPADAGMAINATKYPFELTDTKDADGNLMDVKDQALVVPIEDIADKPTTVKLFKVDSVEDIRLEGITFRIKEKDAQDSDDQLYQTDENGEIKVEYLPAGRIYTIQETATLPGYNLNDEVYEFTVDEDGLIDGSWYHEVIFTNQPNEVHISKQDITTSKELPGAHLKITDMEGNVIDEWISEEEAHIIYRMPAGTYRLTETMAPDGYEVEESIVFEVKDSLIVQPVVMKDSPYREVEISKKDITNSEELPGCTLTVRDAIGTVVDTWVSGTEPHKLKLHSGLYTLTEDKQADGYVTSDTITFEVIKTTAEDFLVMPVTMVDDITKITISKKDITNSEELPGATLTITDPDGNVVAEWVSTTEPHYIEKLPIGKYILTEVTAPDGYEVAESIEFEVKDTGDIQHYTMFDSPYREIVVSKKDLTTSEEIEGATLQVLDQDEQVVEEWISGADGYLKNGSVAPHTFTLPSGRYTLIETVPADGYVTADSITFEVLERNAEGDFEVQNVEMYDDVTKVEISKQDLTTEKELPGAKLEIRNSEGDLVDAWTSTNEPHYIEMLPIGDYTLKELTAPDGYEVAEVVDFSVLDTGEIQHVVMYDAPTPEAVEAPQTGDGLDPTVLAVVIAVVAVLILGGVGLVKKGKKKSLSEKVEALEEKAPGAEKNDGEEKSE